MELTIHADSEVVQKLKGFNNKRNKSFYDVAESVSEQDLTEMRKLATDLQRRVGSWLKETHPELSKG